MHLSPLHFYPGNLGTFQFYDDAINRPPKRSPVDFCTPAPREAQAELTWERQQSTHHSEGTTVSRSKYIDFSYVIHITESPKKSHGEHDDFLEGRLMVAFIEQLQMVEHCFWTKEINTDCLQYSSSKPSAYEG
ncbi:hypothetical protein UY3_12104 [Chelonia mydas]|uniref:Uncharacterized protein n=1 Tax=Chelonia mydas TaxID=8469 RepID=M7BF91_CHEMY|nr:hypothetical protein UY3_12104 [Chelonia mydas]